MIITAKFASVCPCCSSRIAVGEKVEWERGAKARHAACAGKPAVATASRSTSRRSAYSRGYGTSRQYGWDGVVGSPSYYWSGQYDEDS
jgi:hypothetical protein